MRCLRSIRTNLTKAVPSAQTFHVILEAMTQSISLGRGGTRSALQALAHPSNNRFPSFRLNSHSFLQAAAGSWISIRAANLGLHQFGFHHRDVECIWPRVGQRLECASPPRPSPSHQRSIPKFTATAWLNVRIHPFFCVWCSHKASPVPNVCIKDPTFLCIAF